MTAQRHQELNRIDVTDREHWIDGPPHRIFGELRRKCPVHWSEINEYENEEGFWSITRADDVRTVSLDWETFSSERGGVTGLTHAIPIELTRAMFIAMDPPKHDRLKMLFQRGFTPKRIAEHEMRSGRSLGGCSTRSPTAAGATSSPTSRSRWYRA
jgi:cytochrome P450